MTKEIPKYNDQEEKKKFFSLEIIDTDEQLFNFMKTLPSLYNEEKGIWRGLPESKFKLYNSLQRENLMSRSLNSVHDVIEFIENSVNLLEKWNRGVVQKYFDKNHKISNVPIYAALSILQHHGRATPLLDWTRNPNVAMYFAASNKEIFINKIIESLKKLFRNKKSTHIDNYFSIYFITQDHPYYRFTRRTGYAEIYGDDNENPYVKEKVNFVIEHGGDECLQEKAAKNARDVFVQKKLNDKDSIKKDIAKFPIQRIEDSTKENTPLFLKVNNNINAQSGLFILNADPLLPFEESIIKRVKDSAISENDIGYVVKQNKENFICYDINKKFIPKIIEALNSEQINITKENMFPDFNKLKEEFTFEKIVKNIRKTTGEK